MLDNVEIQRGELSTSEYLDLTRQIAMYSASEEVELIRDEVIDLDNDSEFELDNVIPKWETGFTPMDAITGGHYQSITMLIGRPGHGKTSLMLSILESMVISNVASSVWFVELEIPGELMRYRIKPIRERTNFRKGKDLLLCGNHTIESIQEMVKENPDPGRVIFIDSPDVMASGAGEQKRHVLEEIYLKLIQLKWDTQALIVSSWPRRRDRTISLESAAEAWAKAWYSDIIIGLAKLGQTRSGMNNVRLNIVKNRFGPSEQETTFQYNYNDLSWDYTGGSFNEEDW
jgi:predicted ATP-dependent serine protease